MPVMMVTGVRNDGQPVCRRGSGRRRDNINVSYKKVVMQSVTPQLLDERDLFWAICSLRMSFFAALDHMN